VNINAAIETYRYWSRQTEMYAEHTPNIDTALSRAQLRRLRTDADGLIRRLSADGIAIVENYWPAEKCAAGRAEIDRLIATYPEAVRRYSGESDKRMFGVESVSPLLAEFHDDPFLSGIGEASGGLALYNFVTLGARIDGTPENNGSGDGWHRDAYGFQFKSILYLSDVDDSNGPFEYLTGSHKQWRAALDTALGNLPGAPNTRYEPAAIKRMQTHFGLRSRQYPSQAGTLILAVTSGIHRGKPLLHGTRYALTNYYYHPFQIDKDRIRIFSPLIPGTSERVIGDLRLQ
jgi:phytanoyl-CoA dioxygenase PhyH